MREIKIRGRDEKGKVLGIVDLSQNPKYYPKWFVDRTDDVKLELSTGYTDRKGKEIFEGDTINIICYGIEVRSRYTGKITKKREILQVYTDKVSYIPEFGCFSITAHLIFPDQVGTGDNQKVIELRK